MNKLNSLTQHERACIKCMEKQLILYIHTKKGNLRQLIFFNHELIVFMAVRTSVLLRLVIEVNK